MEVMKRVQGMVQESCISFCVLLAQDYGLFDVLRAADGPLTSHQVADFKKLKERYVREILGCLTSISLVQISSNDNGEPTYFLQDDLKKEIDKGSLSSNLIQVKLLMSQYHSTKALIPVDAPHGKLYDEGVFHDFDVMNRQRIDVRLNDLLENVPGLQERLEQGINVIEFGSGSGKLLSKLAIKFPNSEFTISEMNDSLVARLKTSFDKIPNMRFETYDICDMKEFPSKKFDLLLTIHVVHDLPHPLVAMKNMKKMTKEKGGQCVLYDMAGPSTHAGCVGINSMAVNFSFSTFLCIPESFQTKESEAYGACWGTDTAVSLLKKSGFEVNYTMVCEDEAIFVCECGDEFQ